MKINQENLAHQTAILSVTVEAADYAPKVDASLRTHRRKANVPGYRPGMVPMTIINKMYRKGAVAEETYRAATDAAFAYIKENAIDTIGDLMPSDTQKDLNFDTDTDFEFTFKIGLAPLVELGLTKKDVIEQYTVVPADEMISGYRDNFLKRYGNLVEVDTIEKDEAVDVTLANESMSIENAYVGLNSMSDEERAPFIGHKIGDVIAVNINELYKNEKQRAEILGLTEKELTTLDPSFTATVTKIRAFHLPEVNEEFFAMAFPEGNVKNEDDFAADIKKQVEAELAMQTEFKIADQVRDYLLAKTKLSMPEEFLKSWLFEINEGKFTMEDIEKEFASFLDMMRWDLIKRTIAQSEKIVITEEDALAEQKEMARIQFRYYGMNNVADDMLENYARETLKNQEEAKKTYEKVGERKVISAVADKVTMKVKQVTIEEFTAMMQRA